MNSARFDGAPIDLLIGMHIGGMIDRIMQITRQSSAS